MLLGLGGFGCLADDGAGADDQIHFFLGHDPGGISLSEMANVARDPVGLLLLVHILHCSPRFLGTHGRVGLDVKSLAEHAVGHPGLGRD